MIDPAMVVAQIEQGAPPANWRILRGAGSPVGTALVFGFFTLIFVGMCEFALVAGSFAFGFLNLFQTQSTIPDPTSGGLFSPESSNPLSTIFAISPLILLIPFLVAAGVGFLIWSQASLKKDSRLILLPEGVVQCLNYSKPAKRKFNVLDYAEIARMDLRVSTSSTYNPTTHTTSRSTRMWLDLLKRDGMQERWVLNRLYGAPEAMAQQIIAGHAQYVALHPQSIYGI